MRTGSLFVAVSLALSVVAANVQQNNRNNNNVFGGNRGGFGNNNNNGGFNGRNGQNNQNQNGRGGNNNNNNNNNNNKGSTAKGASTSVAATSTAVAVASAVSTSAAAASSTAAASSGDPQTSLTLDPKVIASGFANNGQDVPTAGQVASLTSTNNFINFCLTVPNLPITNGKQITTGSCNPAPMGSIPSVDNMPSAKFVVPKNGDSFAENAPFTVTMAIAGMETGNFVNAEENYFAAPQQLNAQGQIIGHSHIVIETLSALDSTTPSNPKVFAFFKGLNAAASGGVLTADVTSGLPAGFYKVSSINTAANHQPVLVPIAQHGSLDDAVYFTVTANGTAAASSAAAASTVAIASSASAVAPVATAKGAAPPAKAPAPPAKAPAPPAPAPPANGKAPAPPARVAQPPPKRPTPPSRGQSGRFRRSRATYQL